MNNSLSIKPMLWEYSKLSTLYCDYEWWVSLSLDKIFTIEKRYPYANSDNIISQKINILVLIIDEEDEDKIYQRIENLEEGMKIAQSIHDKDIEQYLSFFMKQWCN